MSGGLEWVVPVGEAGGCAVVGAEFVDVAVAVAGGERLPEIADVARQPLVVGCIVEWGRQQQYV